MDVCRGFRVKLAVHDALNRSRVISGVRLQIMHTPPDVFAGDCQDLHLAFETRRGVRRQLAGKEKDVYEVAVLDRAPAKDGNELALDQVRIR